MSSWRSSGITFLKYSQLCAEHVRDALKEPMKAKKIAAEGMHVRMMKYEGGKRVSTTVIEDAATAAVTAAANK
jgi:F-type H+-transporting ATPase subunit epsilon